jgi:cytoplasmic iron level regulating protein YaaA (DUF328/UPF0246 family)
MILIARLIKSGFFVSLHNNFQENKTKMLLLISPAKTLNTDPSNLSDFSIPTRLKESEELVKILKKYKKDDLMKLMDVSEKIAELNVQRFKNFRQPFNLENAKQAILAFDGDVYDGLSANDFTEEDFSFSQSHLRILSGLYGVLKPLDLMQAYRLEMGSSLKNNKGKNLYQFWGEKITEELNKTIKENNFETVINLASNEYWSAVNPKKLNARVIEIQFKELKGSVFKVVSFNAKKARGTMCRHIIKNRINNPEELLNYSIDGYLYSEDMSTDKVWTFIR